MAILMPSARWRDPESIIIEQAAPEVSIVAAPLGSHMSWVLEPKQAEHLHTQLGSLLARRAGGAQ